MHSKEQNQNYSFRRIMRTGWINFCRHSFLAFGATGVLALALLVFSGLIVLNFLTGTVIATLNEKVDISIYFGDEAKENQIFKIKSDLEGLENVKNVAYISKDQALEDFKIRHREDQLIQESIAELDANPLQASLNVKAFDSSQYASIVQFLEANPLKSVMDKINFYENESAINRVRGISQALATWGLGVSVFLALMAILVTFNTIRLTIYNKKEEIEIMRLVGASNWHIRGPFLVEGGFYGLFAAFLALAIFYPVVFAASPKIAAFAPAVKLSQYFTAQLWQMLLIVIGCGLALGVVSSFIAIRRHLKI